MTVNRYPPDGSYYSVTMGFNFRLDSGASLKPAQEFLQGALTQPTLHQAQGWLAILQAACAPRQTSEATAAVALSLYSRTLMEYPADVAKAACMSLARGKGEGVNWFPTLAEVINECDKLFTNRQMMIRDLPDYEPRPPNVPLPTPRHMEDAGEQIERDRQAVKLMLEEFRASRPRPVRKSLPAAHGAVGPGGITPEMRALLNRKAAMTA